MLWIACHSETSDSRLACESRLNNRKENDKKGNRRIFFFFSKMQIVSDENSFVKGDNCNYETVHPTPDLVGESASG